METHKPLLKDADGEDVDEHMYRLMIGSLMYLTSSRPDIIYLKGQPKLGLWYPKDSPFDLMAYTDSGYAGASLDRKSTIGGYQFLGCRLISWQCKKQTVVANSITEAEYVAASSCCVKNPVFHSKTKHIEIRHHFIRDSNEKKLIQMIKIHTDKNVADLLTKAFDNVDSSVKFLVYPSTQRRIWELLKLVQKVLSGAVTPLFPTMMVQAQEEMGEEPIADEAANEENVPTHSNDPLLSGEDSLKLNDLMEILYKIAIKESLTEKKGGSRTHKLKRLFKVGRFAQVISSEDEGLGDQEDASKQGRKIDDIDQDAEVTLVDETQGRYDDAQMFDIDLFNGEEVFVAEQSEKVVEEVISTPEVSAAATITTE
ncbi:hypothetical protein Tco_0322097 [Tanacetum coccineum]